MMEVLMEKVMIDFDKLDQYRENNRIEAKKATGGLPKSMWETYSSFANTDGGVILLGVEEWSDKSLHPVELNDPQSLVDEFWKIVNNPGKVSINLLSSDDVQILETEGKKIIAIYVPRAERMYRPIYLNDNLWNSYRRNGEGDYRCTREECQAMVRDASYKSQDKLLLEEMDMHVFNEESIRSYRQRMQICRPGHVFESLDNEEFLMRAGAIGIGKDGKKHPTSAGLLMFGNEYDIVKEYDDYFLDYQEKTDADVRWTDRIISSSGDWSGNVYDFYFKVYNRIIQNIKTPFSMKNGIRIDDTPVHKALREALANCLVNADYYGRRGVVIIQKRNEIILSNPGGFRISKLEAVSGGVSDPRNATLLKMFNLIDIGERAGSGIPNIYRVWKEQKWAEPRIIESFEPERTELILEMRKNTKVNFPMNIADERSSITVGDNKSAIKVRCSIIQYLSEHESAGTSEIAAYIGLKPSRTRDYMRQLVSEGIVISEGMNRNRRYRMNKSSKFHEY